MVYANHSAIAPNLLKTQNPEIKSTNQLYCLLKIFSNLKLKNVKIHFITIRVFFTKTSFQPSLDSRISAQQQASPPAKLTTLPLT